MIHKISGYATSKDYELLFELMQKVSVICIIDYRSSDHTSPSRDISQTLCGDDQYQIEARGIGYLWADNKEEFLKYAEMQNVEFIVPNIKS